MTAREADVRAFLLIGKMTDKNISQTEVTKRLLTINETAKYLGISPRTIYNGISRKSKVKFPISPKRVGRAVRFDLKDLNRFIESQ